MKGQLILPFQLIRRCALVCAVLVAGVVVTEGQPTRVYPAFTLTTETTAFDAKGEVVSTYRTTRYDSATGDWRYVRQINGYEIATLYRIGRGVFTADSRTQLIIRVTNGAGGCPLRTAELLRKDPKFVRTENILGFEAYVLRQEFPQAKLVTETSYVPELGGGVPFSRVTSWDDRKIVEQPVALVMGEPAASDVSGPDYPVIDQLPTYDKALETKTISRPAPIFPANADSGGYGNTIFVSVVVGQNGRVLTANANMPVTFLTEPAIAAAYQTTFEPVMCNGRAVLGTGVLRYRYREEGLAKN